MSFALKFKSFGKYLDVTEEAPVTSSPSFTFYTAANPLGSYEEDTLFE